VKSSNEILKIYLRIVVPSVLTVTLFVLALFFVVLPSFREALLDKKKEMIRELTQTAWSVLKKYHHEEQAGVISVDQAQKQAVMRIEYLRYGESSKDYFWITDMRPVMVMHPYRHEMDGLDLSEYADPEGKKLFAEAVKIVKEKNEGYIDYKWQWKDDTTRIVPKLSFVKGFEPWGWIIGTGIYVDDVHSEIRNITRTITWSVLVIGLLLILVLFYIARQNIIAELRRIQAEALLIESKNRYQALAESSSEGIIMFFEDNSGFANRTMLEIFGFQENTFSLDKLLGLIEGEKSIRFSEILSAVRTSELPYGQIELNIQTASLTDSFIVSISRISFTGKEAILCLFREIGKDKRKMEALGRGRIRFAALASKLNIGVFRMAGKENLRFVEANKATADILGFENPDKLAGRELSSIIPPEDSYNGIVRPLSEGSVVTREMINYTKPDGSIVVLHFSGVPIQTTEEESYFFDCILEDVTRRMKIEKEKDDMLSDLQMSLQYIEMPVSRFAAQANTCKMNDAIEKVVKLMTNARTDAVIVCSEDGSSLGIITNEDLRNRVIVEKIDTKEPVYKIMSAPLKTVSESTLLFEAMAAMKAYKVSHLPVQSETGDVTGIINASDLFNLHRSSFNFLISEVRATDNPAEIAEIRHRLAIMTGKMVESGFGSKQITRAISVFNDIVSRSFIEKAIKEIGEPPVKFAFIALGSEGREEQTLATDQDNAIIYVEDNNHSIETIIDYFSQMAHIVNDLLAEAGYSYCKGGIMAKNPKWTASIDTWKLNFSKWVAESQPKDLMEINIFMDIRCLYGEKLLVEELWDHIHAQTAKKPIFFAYMAKTAVAFKPPINIFGNVSFQGKELSFDIKKALMPVVNFARLYALKSNITETNTFARIRALGKKGIISERDANELQTAYDFLLQQRFKSQAKQIMKGIEADNIVEARDMTEIEQSILKKVFSVISGFQTRLINEFHVMQ